MCVLCECVPSSVCIHGDLRNMSEYASSCRNRFLWYVGLFVVCRDNPYLKKSIPTAGSVSFLRG